VAVSIPPLAPNSVLVAGYDAKDGSLRLVNLDTLRQLQVLAERLHALDRVDSRNAQVTATIAAGSAVGASARGSITVPAGEVWFINRIRHVSPAESGVGVGDIVQTNVRISKWTDPGGDTDGKAYNAAAIGTAAEDTTDEDLPAQGELGEELRLDPGDVVTLVATLTGAAAGADLTATLTLFGRRGKLLVS
jgi:hypothetical protein